VTDDDVTSKKILQRGNLQRRVTLIPINKIQSGSLNRNVVEYAQNKVGAENVQWAMSLIDYDRYYEPVMKFCFGGTLICKDLIVAKQVSIYISFSVHLLNAFFLSRSATTPVLIVVL